MSKAVLERQAAAFLMCEAYHAGELGIIHPPAMSSAGFPLAFNP
jgi:hypothetical protein